MTLLPFLKEVADAQVAACSNGCMNASNLGIVFAPSTVYDPEEPGFGIGAATKLFARIIENADSFRHDKIKKSRTLPPPPTSSELPVPPPIFKRARPASMRMKPLLGRPAIPFVSPPPHDSNVKLDLAADLDAKFNQRASRDEQSSWLSTTPPVQLRRSSK